MALIIDLDIDKCSACGPAPWPAWIKNDIDTQRCEARSGWSSTWSSPTAGDTAKYTYMATACMHCAEAPASPPAPAAVWPRTPKPA